MGGQPKGSNAERELIHMFWQIEGWVACRVAGSGRMPYPSPDVIAGNKQKKLAIECKTTAGDYQYLTKEEVAELIQFSQRFDAEPWIGMKFTREGWFFIKPENLTETNKNFTISRDEIKQKGIEFVKILLNVS